jgi:hypothetical protein
MGSLAFAWSIFMIYQAWWYQNWYEIIFGIGKALWLFENLWWYESIIY